MMDLIDRNALLHDMTVRFTTIADWHYFDCVAEQPTIEAEPVRHGRWIKSQTDLICSVCKWEYSDELPFMSRNGLDSMTEAFAYCPHCGTMMDGGDLIDQNQSRK